MTNDLNSKMPVRFLGRKALKKIKLIDSSIDDQVGDRVHIDCRRNLVRPPYVKVSTSVGVSDSTFNVTSRRSQMPKFSLKDIFCGHTAKYDGKKKGFETIPVKTKDFQDSIGSVCRKRNYEWSNVVLGHLEYAQDIHATESVCHQTCSVNFRTGKGIPKQFSSDYEKDAKKAKQGRPVDAVKNSAFTKVIQISKSKQQCQISYRL